MGTIRDDWLSCNQPPGGRARRSGSTLIISFCCLNVGTENSAEDERHLRQVGGSRLSRRRVSETEDGRPHPGCQRHQPGGDGLHRVSIRLPARRSAAHFLPLVAPSRTLFRLRLRGRELIRSSGDDLRLLVAKMDAKSGSRGSAKCWGKTRNEEPSSAIWEGRVVHLRSSSKDFRFCPDQRKKQTCVTERRDNPAQRMITKSDSRRCCFQTDSVPEKTLTSVRPAPNCCRIWLVSITWNYFTATVNQQNLHIVW